jgi:hypothetical protein
LRIVALSRLSLWVLNLACAGFRRRMLVQDDVGRFANSLHNRRSPCVNRPFTIRIIGVKRAALLSPAMPGFLLAVLAAAYGPPSDFDARDAIARRYADQAAAKTYGLHQYELQGMRHYPADVRVARCQRVEEGDLDGRFAGQKIDGAFSCIIEVSPNVDPPFVAKGVFWHDSFSWRYVGPLSEIAIDSYDEIVKSGATGSIRPKPGSEVYDGDSLYKPNDGARSQYEDILRSFEPLEW